MTNLPAYLFIAVMVCFVAIAVAVPIAYWWQEAREMRDRFARRGRYANRFTDET